WLGEALVKRYGFMGLRDGMRLLRGVIERFWDPLYPSMEEGDLEARGNAVKLFSDWVGYAIKEAPITKTVSGVSYSFFLWASSKEFDTPENINDLGSEERQIAEEKRERAARERKITSEQWRVAKAGTPRAFYEELQALLDECWAEYQVLDLAIDAHFDRQTP